MNFYRNAITALALLTLSLTATAQTRQTREEYVDRYKSIAVAHMERYGIPASITMAQGILESDAGNSPLSRESNNHFGIKCKKDWTGERVYHDDDERGECFRCYPTVEASYEDHAEFLDKQPRYDSLFRYAPDDYKSWARGLKAAGYATASDYAIRLVRIIEESKLYLLDRPDGETLYAAATGAGVVSGAVSDGTYGFSAVRSDAIPSGIDPDNFRVTVNAHAGYDIYCTNGVCYVLAGADDTYESIGRKFRISARNLRNFNDNKGRGTQPEAGEPVYIGRKQNRWEEQTAYTHTLQADETLRTLAQTYGIRLRSLARRNGLKTGETPAQGTQIRIR